jgi:hypothetical protein
VLGIELLVAMLLALPMLIVLPGLLNGCALEKPP